MIQREIPGTFVLIEWEDACYTEELAVSEYPATIAGIVAGILVEETDAHIAVALEWFQDGTFRRITTIPRAMVLSIEYLIRSDEEVLRMFGSNDSDERESEDPEIGFIADRLLGLRGST